MTQREVVASYARRIERAREDAAELVELAVEIGVDDRLADDHPLQQSILERLAPLAEHVIELPLPAGLAECGRCGEICGTARRTGSVSVCLCEGIICRFCGAGRARPPLTDRYDTRTRTFWHTPWLGAEVACAACRADAEEIPDVASSLTAGCCGIDEWYRDGIIDALRTRWRPPLSDDATEAPAGG